MKYNIGNLLRSLRKNNELTTQELADRVNVSQSYISRFENNRAIPDVDMLEKILNALNTDLPTFFNALEDDIPNDLINLIKTVKTLSPEARIKLNEFLLIIKNQS